MRQKYKKYPLPHRSMWGWLEERGWYKKGYKEGGAGGGAGGFVRGTRIFEFRDGRIFIAFRKFICYTYNIRKGALALLSCLDSSSGVICLLVFWTDNGVCLRLPPPPGSHPAEARMSWKSFLVGNRAKGNEVVLISCWLGVQAASFCHKGTISGGGSRGRLLFMRESRLACHKMSQTFYLRGRVKRRYSFWCWIYDKQWLKFKMWTQK